MPDASLLDRAKGPPRFRVVASGLCENHYLSGGEEREPTYEEWKRANSGSLGFLLAAGSPGLEGDEPEDDEDRLPTPNELKAWDGCRFREIDEAFSYDYDGSNELARLELAGGFLRFEYVSDENRVRALVEFTCPHELTDDESRTVAGYVSVQLQGRLGENLRQTHDFMYLGLPECDVETFPIAKKDLPDLCGLELGMSRDEVTSILGDPVETRRKYRRYRTPSALVYPEFELHFEPWKTGGLLRVVCDDPHGNTLVPLEYVVNDISRRGR